MSKTLPDKFYFQCTNCLAAYPAGKVDYVCPVCAGRNLPGQPPKGVLKVKYDFHAIRSMGLKGSLFDDLEKEKFLPLLPIRSMDSWPFLRIGGTPLYKPDALQHAGFTCFLKDDSQNPTFSFKDRASALVSAWARENGLGTLVAASTGNAGSSLAGICAAQGQQAVIVVPARAPLAKLTQILMYGARLITVQGTYDDAFDLSIRLSEKYGWYNRNTAYNPLTIEGKKTVSYELFSQLGHSVPDRIFVPTGDGVILAGVYKGFEDLMMLGIIERMPVVVAVQSSSSCNLVANVGRETFVSTPSSTIADSISVDIPRNFYMASACLGKDRGETVTVTDGEILEASRQLSVSAGIFTEPASAAAFAGMLKQSRQGLIREGSSVVTLLTGCGLKDLKAVQGTFAIPEPVDAGFDLPSTPSFLWGKTSDHSAG